MDREALVLRLLVSAAGKAVDIDSSLEANDVDSLAVIEWFFEVEQQFGGDLSSNAVAWEGIDTLSVRNIIQMMLANCS
jgi:acyl carrier protein